MQLRLVLRPVARLGLESLWRASRYVGRGDAMKRYDLENIARRSSYENYRDMVECDDGDWVCFDDVAAREDWWRSQLVEAGRNATAGAQAVRDASYAENELLTNEVEALQAQVVTLTAALMDIEESPFLEHSVNRARAALAKVRP
jgi:hypothetical protein